MAATVARIGKGTSVGYNATTTAGTFTSLAEVLDIKMPKTTYTPVEIERYDSPTNIPELIPGWGKGGELEISITYSAAQAAAIYGLLNTQCQMTVTSPDSNVRTYGGILTSFGDSFPLKDKMVTEATFMISSITNASGDALKHDDKAEVVVNPEHKE
jgi:hypothetical protein